MIFFNFMNIHWEIWNMLVAQFGVFYLHITMLPISYLVSGKEMVNKTYRGNEA